MEIKDFIENLNFEQNDYFYHENSKGSGESIMENGLLVDGTNILGTENILYTTAVPITPDMVEDVDDFIAFLEAERGSTPLREVAEMTIICASKFHQKDIVAPFKDYFNGRYFEGIIEPHFIAGVIDLEDLIFTPNENFELQEDSFGR